MTRDAAATATTAGTAPPTRSPAEPEGGGAFAIEDRVRHAQFGDGEVMSLEGDEITVLFDDVGYRTLSLPAVVSRRLLIPVG